MTMQRLIPAQEIEVFVSQSQGENDGHLVRGELRVRVNGAPLLGRAPRTIQVPYRALLEQYQRAQLYIVDNRQIWRWATSYDYYGEHETPLAQALGDCLLPEFNDVLESCLCHLQDGEFVRLVLCFEDPRLEQLPWELALWRRGPHDASIWLGRDPRFALSRLVARARPRRLARFANGASRLSVLNLLAANKFRDEHDRARQWLEFMEDHGALHATSREFSALPAFRHQLRNLDASDHFQVVQWLGHGGLEVVPLLDKKSGVARPLGADAVIESVGMASLWVFLTCDSGGHTNALPAPSAQSDPDTSRILSGMHADYIRHGAPAVVGLHSRYESDPGDVLWTTVLCGALVRRWPLDVAVQRMRGMRHQTEEIKSTTEPPWRWHKPVLSVATTWNLGGLHTRDPYVDVDPSYLEDFWLERWIAIYREQLRQEEHDATHHVSDGAQVDGAMGADARGDKALIMVDVASSVSAAGYVDKPDKPREQTINRALALQAVPYF